jgi:DNA-3-methyladenine glycosylase I
MTDDGKSRCTWAGDDPLYVAYHDEEWGVPLRDERQLFEMLILEGAQAGLSWITILRKRENYRAAFDNFDPAAIARYGPEKVATLMADAGIVRNRAKIESTIGNAKAWLDLTQREGSCAEFLWRFVEDRPVVNYWRSASDVPAETKESAALSKALKAQGMRFVGPTICYAFMQAAGMVNDHTVDCFRHREV